MGRGGLESPAAPSSFDPPAAGGAAAASGQLTTPPSSQWPSAAAARITSPGRNDDVRVGPEGEQGDQPPEPGPPALLEGAEDDQELDGQEQVAPGAGQGRRARPKNAAGAPPGPTTPDGDPAQRREPARRQPAERLVEDAHAPAPRRSPTTIDPGPRCRIFRSSQAAASFNRASSRSNPPTAIRSALGWLAVVSIGSTGTAPKIPLYNAACDHWNSQGTSTHVRPVSVYEKSSVVSGAVRSLMSWPDFRWRNTEESAT